MAKAGSGSVYSQEYQVFLEQLVAARHRSGLTQRELATKIGKSYSYVSKIEIGATRMDLFQIRQYLRAVDTPFLEFMQDYDKACRRKE